MATVFRPCFTVIFADVTVTAPCFTISGLTVTFLPFWTKYCPKSPTETIGSVTAVSADAGVGRTNASASAARIATNFFMPTPSEQRR